jgi:hypothetical protein
VRAGTLLVVIGVIVVLFAVINHFALHAMSSTNHIDLYIGVLGVVVAVAGVVMSMTGRKAA